MGTPESGRDDANPRSLGEAMAAVHLEAWFVREVLPLEAMLMQFLRHNWRDSLQNFKVSAGYRADFFFGAMDGGLDTAKKENVGFYGPFATISVGLGG
jgi:hypothetical protein